MKVKDLQAALSKLDPDLELICYSEDQKMLSKNQLFRVLEIDDVSTIDAEKTRDNAHNPTLIIGKSYYSERLAVLNVTSDF